MANPGYVRSTDGSDADNGSTWALANATLAGAMADQAAGDRIWVSDNHAESTAGAITITMPGTLASPTQLLCGNDSAQPPTALAATATVTTTGAASAITIAGHGYIYGIAFSAGTASNNVNLNLHAGTGTVKQTYENCDFILGNTGATSTILIMSALASSAEINLIDCGFKFGAAAQAIALSGTVSIRGGGAMAGGTNPTNFIEPQTGEPLNAVIDGFDFSAWSAGLNLILGGAFTQPGSIKFRNCKMPASWSGSLWSTAPTLPGIRAEMWNCSDGDTNYAMLIEDYAGSIEVDVGTFLSGGASDGDTPISWLMLTSSIVEFPHQILRSPEIVVPITSVGSSKTITVEIAQDGTTTALNDDEVWLEVQYLGTSGFSLGNFVDDSKADLMATAAAQTDSSVTWTGLSGTNKKQKLAVTFTPQEKGVAICTICVAKATTPLFVDPLAVVS